MLSFEDEEFTNVTKIPPKISRFDDIVQNMSYFDLKSYMALLEN